ncbi:hypothetical protein A4E84_39040 [Streptomyces qaidamensis]|uniref:Aldehyde dehydrogenase domain-containing protein n=1 Tax=Streptomyces qaidamensis TaxID=1783515 RepID=A0A143CD84_9ACTN|nr:aldehyde dehydrogenase family protein [Streptomyces qaidamensis]AMW14935.1 hypothetical protein A4E84_39040 [Streptomyces qaidamensis]
MPEGLEKGNCLTLTVSSPTIPSGLSRGVWSADEDRALAVARRIRTGTDTVNGAPVAFDGPLGGFKASGVGRECGAVGLGAYTECKTITV